MTNPSNETPTDTERLDWLAEQGDGIALIHDDEGEWIVAWSGVQEIRSTYDSAAEGWSTTYIVLSDEVGGFRAALRDAIDAAILAEREGNRDE